MKRFACAWAAAGLWMSAVGAAPAAHLINEVLANPPGAPDGDREFIELRHTAGPGSATNLAVIQVNGNVPSAGLVDEIWDLDDCFFGDNGLLLIGNNYDNPPNGGPWSDVVSGLTGFGEPLNLGPDDLLNDTCTWLLVSNRNASLAVGGDLDPDNDGDFDVSPGAAILDSVGWSDGDAGDRVYSPASLAQAGGGCPDAATRLPENDGPLTRAAWYNGEVTTAGGDTLGRTYLAGETSANLPPGAYLTPGEWNYPFPAANTNVRINEVYLNPPGTNDAREFIELATVTGGRQDLWGLWLLVIDSAGDTNGVVDDAWHLSGLVTGTNGLMLLGNQFGYPTPGGPWQGLTEPATRAAEPAGTGSSGWGDGDVQDNDDFTLLLVTDFTGRQGDDLDTNDDMRLDSAPWTAVVDGVGLGQTYAAAALRPGFSPDAVARWAGDFRAGTAEAWYGGDILGPDLALDFDAAKTFNLPRGAALTPGMPNYPVEPDSDHDGMPNWWEQQHFQGPTNAYAGGDSDHDGFSNFKEYVADTDPTNPASYFSLLTSRLSEDTLTWIFVIHPSSPRRAYDVLWKTDLFAPDWQAYGFERAGTGGELMLTVTNSGARRFYRPRVRLP